MRRLRLIAVLFGLMGASLSRGTRAVGQPIAPAPGLRPIASSLDRKPQQQAQPAPARQPMPANPPPFRFPVPDDGLTSGPPASSDPAPRKAAPELLPVTFRAEAEGQQAAPAASASAATSISTTTVVAGAPPVVHLQKIGPANLTVGQSLTYEIVLKNTGATPATQVRLEDELPTGARLLEASPRPDHSGSRLLWTLARLEPGEERHWRIRIHPAGAGEIRSSATVTYVAAVASTLRTQVAQPRLAVTLSGPESVQLGEPATFQIQVKNTGSGPAT